MSLFISVIPEIPEIQPNDDLAAILAEKILANIGQLQDYDILVIAQKVISKAEGRIVNLSDITPSTEALDYAKKLAKDPRKVEVVLRESSKVVKSFKHPNNDEGTMICQHNTGHISANAGVDQSNCTGDDEVILLPISADKSAEKIRKILVEKFNVKLGIIISDTFGRPWRLGQMNVAIGVAGMPAKKSEVGNLDANGRPLSVTEPAFADEIAAASGLVIGKASNTPLVLVRGLTWHEAAGTAQDLIRNQKEDAFR